MVRVNVLHQFVSVIYVLSGPRGMVEAASRMLEHCFPTATREFTMFDVVSGDWKVSLKIPR